MKPKFEIGDLVKHINYEILGLVVGFTDLRDPCIEIIRKNTDASSLVEGEVYGFFCEFWKHTEE
jgi:hypothetical protein